MERRRDHFLTFVYDILAFYKEKLDRKFNVISAKELVKYFCNIIGCDIIILCRIVSEKNKIIKAKAIKKYSFEFSKNNVKELTILADKRFSISYLKSYQYDKRKIRLSKLKRE